ncbi:hypothetical protein CGRA01v4_14841 [Colletotrichum graminicola]|nr:hypothetical protein CGRA01v4_14841 [Colletotrichum graminicola]
MKSLEGYSRVQHDNDVESSSEVGEPLTTARKWPKFFAISQCELLWRLTCFLMFISGLSMMAIALTRGLSDKDCAAQPTRS